MIAFFRHTFYGLPERICAASAMRTEPDFVSDEPKAGCYAESTVRNVLEEARPGKLHFLAAVLQGEWVGVIRNNVIIQGRLTSDCAYIGSMRFLKHFKELQLIAIQFYRWTTHASIK